MVQRGINAVSLVSILAILTLNVACGSDRAAESKIDVRINEVSSSTRNFQDANGDTDDWIELYNAGEETVDLAGYFMSDTANNRLKAVLAEGLTIPSHGVLLFWADGQPEQGSRHLDFQLSSQGDGTCLSDPDGYVIDCIEFGPIPAVDASLARFPDGTGNFAWCLKSSPEQPNGDHCLSQLP